jgi:hypothetical protein
MQFGVRPADVLWGRFLPFEASNESNSTDTVQRPTVPLFGHVSAGL